MKEPKRVLFLAQEIYPYLSEETPLRKLNRMLPQACQENGIETRTFMPKFGEINERKNQLHEVIRLSGINVVISDTDHPLLLKVASIQGARLQIYFIDNDDFFKRRIGVADSEGKEYADNDERTIFFNRCTLETIQNLRWMPDVVQCSGWMSALTPLYLKTAYKETPFFHRSKVVVALTDEEYSVAFNEHFADKLRFEGVTRDSILPIRDKQIDYLTLMKFAIDHADAVVVQSKNVHPELIAYAKESGLPMLDYQDEQTQPYVDFYQQLMQTEA